MGLPSLSGLSSLSPTTWRALAARLRAIGLTPACAEPILAAISPVHPALRRPIRNHHLRKLTDVKGAAMRMLMFSDPVSISDAKLVLGDALEQWIDAGLCARANDGAIVSTLVLSLFNDLFIFSDDLAHGGDAVMGFGPGTIELCQAAFPERLLGKVLDLGCGAGTCALVLSTVAEKIVATDINPRATELGRINAMLNGTTNVDFRTGDLFEPVRGETFDLIASQPPFVPMPKNAGDAVFLYGGHRGDELALTALSHIDAHLAEGGRAVLRIDWPEHGSEPLEQRIRASAKGTFDLLILAAPRKSPEEHATSYAAGAHPALDSAFDSEAIGRLAHLEEHGIVALVPTITVLDKPKAAAGRTERLDIVPLERASLTSARIDKLVAARALAENPSQLLAATLRVPDGTIFAEEQVGAGAEVESTLSAKLPDAALVGQIPLLPDLLFLVTFVHEAEDVESAIAVFAEQREMPLDAAIKLTLPAVAKALTTGLLEIPDTQADALTQASSTICIQKPRAGS